MRRELHRIGLGAFLLGGDEDAGDGVAAGEEGFKDGFAEVLLTDESNPRSVAFQLVTLLHQVTRLQELHDRSYDGVERALAVKALAAIRDIRMADIAHRVPTGRFAALDDLIRELKVILYEISDALTSSYLSHLTASRMTVSW